MHQNYYYLRQVTKALEARIAGAVVSECFSQSKDELILRFEVGSQSFYIRASLSPTLNCISFPGEFARARRNSVDLLHPIIGRRVEGLRQFENERSFAIALSDHYSLLFKMHGTRSNVILFDKSGVADLFRSNLSADRQLDPDQLDRTLDWSRGHFMAHVDNLRKVYVTFGKIVWQYLEERDFFLVPAEQRWNDFQSLLRKLEQPSYYITDIDDRPVLSLLETGKVIKVLTDPLEAANEFFYTYTQQFALVREKQRLRSMLHNRIESGESYCHKNRQRLAEVRSDNQYKVWADLIMANLHAIPQGAESVVLQNFYEEQRPVEIRLRKDVSPQKTAEVYYRKAKNQHIEISRLEQSIRQKEEELKDLHAQLGALESAADLRTVKQLAAGIQPLSQPKAGESQPYHEFHFRGFRIWVGKNAQANDNLLARYSYKEDLWLHAKDVSGSHVLIKHQAGKHFPKDVIEFAASLAAFYSRRKKESLCPVMVTPRKFVRKRKGDPPGAVAVEREEVILVAPWQASDKPGT